MSPHLTSTAGQAVFASGNVSAKLAAKLDEDRLSLKDFLLEYVDLTPELAKKIAAVTGIKEGFWLSQLTRHNAAQQPLEVFGSK